MAKAKKFKYLSNYPKHVAAHKRAMTSRQKVNGPFDPPVSGAEREVVLIA